MKELSHNKILISFEMTDFISNLVIQKYNKYFTDVHRRFNHAYFTAAIIVCPSVKCTVDKLSIPISL